MSDVVSVHGAEKRSELTGCELTSSFSEGVISAMGLMAGSAGSVYGGHDFDVQRVRNLSNLKGEKWRLFGSKIN